MKRNITIMVAVAIGMIVTSCGGGINTNISLKSEVDSAFYAIGVINAANFTTGVKTIPGYEGTKNIDALMAGFSTAMYEKTSQLKMTPEEAQEFLQVYFTTAQLKEAEAGKAEGEAFLAANKTKPGVITTESGLQYKVITEGTGKKPVLTDNVIVHYTGKLLNGTVFDSSVERGEPTTYPLANFIEGWKEALLLMPVGSKYQLWVPSNLAYGEQQASQVIKPNSTLEFEVELLGIAENQ
ncbi:MAG: FKBP-type peptidyl-prolyl cis-trans isomerase [Tannerella sp.]|jgi:FKBP-type peptidyl-prolyl cis-trans isomerase|nr:FKBP-type peptidyl-prolyl cis-trans isomerase [Tannerella sp.]